MRFATTLLAAAVSVAGVAGEEAEKTEEVCRRREVGEREVGEGICGGGFE